MGHLTLNVYSSEISKYPTISVAKILSAIQSVQFVVCSQKYAVYLKVFEINRCPLGEVCYPHLILNLVPSTYL